MKDSTILFLAYMRYKSLWHQDANRIRDIPMSHHEFVLWWTDKPSWYFKYACDSAFGEWSKDERSKQTASVLR